MNIFSTYSRFSLIFVFVFALGYFVIHTTYEKMHTQYLKMQSEMMSAKVMTNYKYFKIMSDDIYQIYQANEDVIAALSQAYSASKEERDQLRTHLYSRLIKRYERLKNMGVNQLQFHLKDNTSFLRMHNPKKHGDNIGYFRHTVALTNKNKTPTEGFEIGKHVYGFRFIYPLFDANKVHIGSFGVTYSVNQMLKIMDEKKIVDSHFLVSKDVVDQLKDEVSVKENLKPGWEHPNFFHDFSLHDISNQHTPYDMVRSKEFIKDVQSRIEKAQTFSLSHKINFETLTISFIPFINIHDKQLSGYMSIYTLSHYLDDLSLDERHYKTLYLVVMGLLLLFGLYNIHHRNMLYKMAHIDTLTKLPNRRSFDLELRLEYDKAKRLEQKLAILFIDLDGFKNVNDTYGHDIGDILLKQVAQRLKEVIRSTDIASRFGGDEYAVVLRGLDEKEHALLLANAIVEKLEKPFLINEKKINIGASIGISVYPDHGDDLNKLLKRADSLMYEAKGSHEHKCVMQ